MLSDETASSELTVTAQAVRKRCAALTRVVCTVRGSGTKSGVIDPCPKLPPALRGVLGFKSLALSRHFGRYLSLQEFHRGQVAQG